MSSIYHSSCNSVALPYFTFGYQKYQNFKKNRRRLRYRSYYHPYGDVIIAKEELQIDSCSTLLAI